MGALFDQIQQGFKLKKTVTVDKSSGLRSGSAPKPELVRWEKATPVGVTEVLDGGREVIKDDRSGSLQVVSDAFPSGTSISIRIQGDSNVVAVGIVPQDYDLSAPFLCRRPPGTGAWQGVFWRSSGSLICPGATQPYRCGRVLDCNGAEVWPCTSTWPLPRPPDSVGTVGRVLDGTWKQGSVESFVPQFRDGDVVTMSVSAGGAATLQVNSKPPRTVETASGRVGDSVRAYVKLYRRGESARIVHKPQSAE